MRYWPQMKRRSARSTASLVSQGAQDTNGRKPISDSFGIGFEVRLSSLGAVFAGTDATNEKPGFFVLNGVPVRPDRGASVGMSDPPAMPPFETQGWQRRGQLKSHQVAASFRFEVSLFTCTRMHQ